MRTFLFALAIAMQCGCTEKSRLAREREAKTNSQMNAFDALLIENNVPLDFMDRPPNENSGRSPNLSFLIGTQLEDWPRFVQVLDGPMETRFPGHCYRDIEVDHELFFYSCETNVLQVDAKRAPSARLELAVRDGEIVEYCFTPYFKYPNL